MKEIALELGTNESTLYELLEIERKLTPEIKDLLDTGIISKTSASKIWSKLSEQEQLELLEELGKDKIKEMTIKETEEYINKAKELEESNELLKKSYNDLSKKYEEEKNKEKVVEVEVEKEVVPEDYENNKKRLDDYKKDYQNLQKQLQEKVIESNQFKKDLEELKQNTPQEQYNKKIQDSTIFFCARVSEFLEKVGGYVWITDHINELPELEKKSYLSAVNAISAWAENLRNNIESN